jgi:drug/metabolite transporter (DMT)-like permease
VTTLERPGADNRLRGMALILGAMTFFSTSDAIAKVLGGMLLGASLPPVEIAWLRYCVFVAMTALLARRSRAPLMARSPRLQIVRGLMLVTSAVAFMAALRSLPLADAAAIGFTSPVFITALSVPFLGEFVGRRRWAAVAMGLVGVLIVVRPGAGAFQPAALFSLASSASWAVGIVLTRKMSGSNANTTLLWSSCTGLAVLTVLLPFDFVPPSPAQLGLALVLGLVATTGQILMVQAYRFAPASLLAPFSYSQLLWAVLYGFLLFNALPDLLTVAGAAVIALSGAIAARPEAR